MRRNRKSSIAGSLRTHILKKVLRETQKGGVVLICFIPAEGNFCFLRDPEGHAVGILSIVRDMKERKQAEETREKLILELRDALSKIKKLSGMLPICASCKKIRDDKGYWNQIESYIKENSEAEFSHCLCPECVQRLYPNFLDKK